MMGNTDDLIARLADEAVQVKPAQHPYLLALKWLAAAVVYLGIALGFAGLRPDLAAKLHDVWFVAEITALLGMLLAASASASVLAFPDLHQKRWAALSPAFAFVLLVLALAFAWQADTPPAPLPEHSFECTLSILLVASLPCIWTFLALRRFAASTHAGWAGAVALLAAFSTGALWLRLHEINDSILHVLEWHYLPMLACGGIGLWLGKKLLKW